MILHHKKQVPIVIGGDGDGSKADPWYWYGKTQGQTVSLDNTGTSGNDNCRLYLRVKLLANTTYSIGETSPGGGDGKIWLYNESELTSDDDSYAEIAGIECSDSFEYTPSATGIYLIGAGAYSSSQGSYTVAINPAPESDPVPTPGIIYPTSTGFNSWGKPSRFRSASAAGCAVSLMPKQGLVFYAPLKEAAAAAETGQTLSESGTVTYQTYKGIDCAYFDGSARLATTDLTGIPYGSAVKTVSGWFNMSFVNNFNFMFMYGNRIAFRIYDNNMEYLYGSGGTRAVRSSVSAGIWYHFAAVYTESSTKLYKNGQFVAETSDGDNSTLGDYPLVIGGFYDRYGTGYIAGVRIYNRALAEKEIGLLSAEFQPTT